MPEPTCRTVQPLDVGGRRVDIVRSRRRKRTVSAYRDGERTVVLLPAGMARPDEERWVADMLQRLAAREARQRTGDGDLMARARSLSSRFLAGRAEPLSVRWVGNQRGRWGSCTPSDRTIRLSDRLQGMPPWVVDYVLVHELAHLLVPAHGADFWALVDAYPRTERARGYLEGVAAAAGLPPSDIDSDTDLGDVLGGDRVDVLGDRDAGPLGLRGALRGG